MVLIYFGNFFLINSVLLVYQYKMGWLNCFNVGNCFLNYFFLICFLLVFMKLYIILLLLNVMLICIKICMLILMLFYMYQVVQYVLWYGWLYVERYYDLSFFGNNDLNFCEYFVWIRWFVFVFFFLFQYFFSNIQKQVQLLLIRNVVVQYLNFLMQSFILFVKLIVFCLLLIDNLFCEENENYWCIIMILIVLRNLKSKLIFLQICLFFLLVKGCKFKYFLFKRN